MANRLKNERHQRTLIGIVLGIVASVVYILTLEPTVSFWDCGEFIATSYKLQIGHPPGAPLYQLIAHHFCLLAGDNVSHIAYCCNLLSAIAGGVTVSFLYWSILTIVAPMREGRKQNKASLIVPAVGALCYLFCDTAWFSAVESEVYSLAMMFCSIIFWAALRWYNCKDSENAPRWIILIAFLCGMGVCVHMMVLLTLPAVAVIVLCKKKNRKNIAKTCCFALFFFVIGLTPYLIVPIRANANPPINCGNPCDIKKFKSYIAREQYEKAPLYPRMWRHRNGDDTNAAQWSGGDTTFVGNLRYYTTYQLGFMYGRYIVDNFIARKNKKSGNTVWYIIPIVLAIIGIYELGRTNKKRFWWVMVLFLTSGPLLNFYLNHPCYEPRDRDYVYVLSFYAISVWIAAGSLWIWDQFHQKKKAAAAVSLVLLAGPAMMAAGNWSDHDRSRRFTALDSASNILNSCDKDAILFTWGDNDTFPLWYAQQVEGKRTDIQIANVNLIGYHRFFQILEENMLSERCYLSQYAYDQLHQYFEHRIQLVGMTYQIKATRCGDIDIEAFKRHLDNGIEWHDTTGVYLDAVSHDFLKRYQLAVEKYDKSLSTR